MRADNRAGHRISTWLLEMFCRCFIRIRKNMCIMKRKIIMVVMIVAVILAAVAIVSILAQTPALI